MLLPKIVYITSHGHSGSTLLDLLISGHSEVVSVGEAKLFSPEIRHELPCSCRADSVWDCSFWRQVDTVLRDGFSIPLREIDLRGTGGERFVEHNAAFYQAVAKVAGISVVVDSSKDNRRLRGLLDSGRFDLHGVHLIRRAHGVAYSQVKKGRDWFRTCVELKKRVLKTRRLLRVHDHTEVRYEELATDPVAVLSPLMEKIALSFEPQQLDWAGRERHNCGGNRMRYSKDSKIRLDEGWKKGLKIWQKATISLMGGIQRDRAGDRRAP